MNNIPKGTKDVLPAESWQWQYLEQTARAVTEAYRFEEIRTPTFEHTEVFLRGIGDTTVQPDNAQTRGKVAKIGYLLQVTEVE